MMSASIPNRTDTASPGVGAYPSIQRGGAFSKHGMSVSTCARIDSCARNPFGISLIEVHFG